MIHGSPPSRASTDLTDVLESLRRDQNQLSVVRRDIEAIRRRQARLEQRMRLARRVPLLTGTRLFDLDRLSEEVMDLEFQLVELRDEEERLARRAVFDFGDFNELSWRRLQEAFAELRASEIIWDVVHEQEGYTYRSTATSSIQRRAIRVGDRCLDKLHPSFGACYFGNANGPDLYIYPTVLAAREPKPFPRPT